MHENGGKNGIGADGEQREDRAAYELIDGLHGVLVKDGKEQSAQKARRDCSDILDPLQDDAAEERFLQDRGENRDHKKNAEKPAPFERRQRDLGQHAAHFFDGERKEIVHPVEPEQQSESQNDRDDIIFPVRLTVTEFARFILIDARKGENDRDIYDLIQKVGKIFVPIRIGKGSRIHAQKPRDGGEGNGKQQADDDHADDGARINEPAHSLAGLIQKPAFRRLIVRLIFHNAIIIA